MDLKRLFCGLLLALACLLAIATFAPAAGDTPTGVLYVELGGAISPAQVDLLEAALDAARQRGDALLLLRLDTPGGLSESMRRMVQLMLNAPVPVVVWVGPAGAHAASAGVFLVAASAAAGMSPQATIGAASPVDIGGGELSKTMAEKVKNDILSLVRGVVEARHRNVDWYVKAVEESVSATGVEAVQLRVVEYLAGDPQDLLVQVGARGIDYHGQTLRFDGAAARLDHFEPGFRYRILSWLLDPQVAYLLLLGGLAGLFFEFATPGAIVPGVVGGLCLLLGLYALSILPTNVAGLLLIIFGVVLFILEIHFTSYGLLSVAAILALFIGSTILFRAGPGFAGLPLRTTVVTVAAVSALIGAGVWLAAKAQAARPALGLSSLVGTTAVVRSWQDTSGQVFVHGELWNATSRASGLAVGARVHVVAASGLTLTVAPLEEAAAAQPHAPSHDT